MVLYSGFPHVTQSPFITNKVRTYWGIDGKKDFKDNKAIQLTMLFIIEANDSDEYYNYCSSN